MRILDYLSWSPQDQNDITYNQNGALPQLESWHPTPTRQLPLQPNTWYDNRLSYPSSYLANVQKGGYTTDGIIFYPVADTNLRYAPEQPIREDIYNMLVARKRGPNVSGQSPINASTFTGVEE